MDESRLFKAVQIGAMHIKHRIGLAPLTRFRATASRAPSPIMVEYYAQRSAVPGTLLISEGTLACASGAGGFDRAPGIWTDEHIAGWKAVTDAVHRKGCFIFCQIFAMGRVATTEGAEKDGVSIVAPSAIPLDEAGAALPRPMTLEEIRQCREDFARASENAVAAGFDGVEIHAANGYLLDQFTQDTSNQRDDQYGGSVENRSRFVCEVLEAAVNAIGAERVGVRLSPWSTFQVTKMKDPITQFSDVIVKANRLKLAYLHLIESRVSGGSDALGTEPLDFAYPLWDGPILVAGGYKLAGARRLVDEEYPDKNIVVMFGRDFIANPDLVHRMKTGLELTKYQRQTFYSSDAAGYVDYPFSAEYLQSIAA